MKIILIGNIAAGKSMVARWIQLENNWPIYSIDEIRKKIADGTVAGEYEAYAQFLRYIQSENHCILEFSGVGVHKHAVRYALELNQYPFILIHVDSSMEICQHRHYRRGFEDGIPYPFPISSEELIKRNAAELMVDELNGFWEIKTVPHCILKFDNPEDTKAPHFFFDLFSGFMMYLWEKIKQFSEQNGVSIQRK